MKCLQSVYEKKMIIEYFAREEIYGIRKEKGYFINK